MVNRTRAILIVLIAFLVYKSPSAGRFLMKLARQLPDLLTISTRSAAMLPMGVPVLERAKAKRYESLPNLKSPSKFDKIYCNVPNGAKPSATSHNSRENPEEFVESPWRTNHAGGLFKRLEQLANTTQTSVEEISYLIQQITGIQMAKGRDSIVSYYYSLDDKGKANFIPLIKNIAKLAAKAPNLFPEPIQYLSPIRQLSPSTNSSSATFSQEQCACLLAHCFFCTFKNSHHNLNIFHMSYQYRSFGSITMLKWRFYFNYFETFFSTLPNGIVSFRRARATPLDWENSKEKFSRLEIVGKGIEDCANCMQMDFADKYIGGITLSDGLLQEEIRFLIFPESIVAQLFIPLIEDDEAVFIVGAQRYSSYHGYDHSTSFLPFTGKLEERDEFGRLENEMVAIDAAECFRLGSKSEQFQKKWVDRELLKLQAGFATSVSEKRPVATGNWGCGAFLGDLRLKGILQLMAAAKTGRDMVYCPFSQIKFAQEFAKIHKLLVEKNVTVGDVYKFIIKGDFKSGDIFSELTMSASKFCDVRNVKFKALPDLGNPSKFDYIYCGVPNGAKHSNSEPIANPDDYVTFPWSTEFGDELVKKLQNFAYSKETDIHKISKMVQDITGIVMKEGKDTLVAYYGSLEDKKKKEFPQLIKQIAKLALRGSELFKEPIRYLSALRDFPEATDSASVTLSQEQCACLMAHCLFCTFNSNTLSSSRFHLGFWFIRLANVFTAKWRFIFNYFEIFFATSPNGLVSFRRVRTNPPDWANSTKTFTKLEVVEKGIEDCDNCLQMDFANKRIGGGVLKMGCVQEEIRFLLCPEMIVSLLFITQMQPDEAVFIVGAQRYSSYTGYGSNTKFKPFEGKLEARDEFGRLQNELVAIDATRFENGNNISVQHQRKQVDRELLKLYSGFHTSLAERQPVATGNWGCGAFKGDLKIKSLLQLIAAAQVGRDVVYCPFAETEFSKRLIEVHKLLIEKNVTVGFLYNYVVKDEFYNGDILSDLIKELK